MESDQSLDDIQKTLPHRRYVPPGFVRRIRERIFRRRLLQATIIAILLALFLAWLPPLARIELVVGIIRNRSIILMLLVFSVLMVSLLWAAGQKIDASVFLFVNLHGHRPLWLDRAMWWTTQMGNMAFAIVLAAGLYLFGDIRVAVELVLGILSLWLAVEIIKAITDRARPFTLLTQARIIGWRELGRSFPSGHTAQSFFIASLVAHHLPLLPGVAVVVYLLATLVAITRMYVGAHYPRDVVAGALLGLVWGLLSVLLNPYL